MTYNTPYKKDCSCDSTNHNHNNNHCNNNGNAAQGKKRNFTTGPIIKPVKFDEDDNAPKQQIIVKSLNNTSQPQTVTIAVYNLGGFAAENTKAKTMGDCLVEVDKALFFSQTIEVRPQSTVFLPVDITTVTEYEVQILDVPVGLYFSTEFIPTTPIPTAQARLISTDENEPGEVIDSHIVTYSHQFVILE